MRSHPTRRGLARTGSTPRTIRPSPQAALSSAAHGARPKGIEKLEDRLLLSSTLPRDANGFSVPVAVPGARVIYVSSTGGDNNNSGLSPSSPVQTIAQGRSLMRDGTADALLLRRGDTFSGSDNKLTNWSLSGTAAVPMIIGAYTDPARPAADRPKVLTGKATGFSNAQSSGFHPAISHVYLMGIAFEANSRNYRQPPASGFTTGYTDDVVGGTYGVSLLGQASDVQVEDCAFQYFRTGLSVQYYSAFGDPSDVRLRRNQVLDSYAPNYDSKGNYITSEGLYADGVHGLTLEENVFDHNGWADSAYSALGANPSIYNHDVYLNIHNDNVVITGNVFSNAASHGVQARAGGVVTNNLFVNDPIALSYGYVNGAEKAGGVSGVISGNVVYGSRDISGSPRGWGLELGNLRPASAGGGTVVKDNVYAGYAQNGQPAIQLTIGTNAVNPQEGVGINDLTIQNNVVYGWTKGITLNPGLTAGSTARNGLNRITVANNDFQNANATPVVEHGPVFNASAETWRNNRYQSVKTDTTSTPYFRTKNSTYTLSGWQAAAEPTATNVKVNYPEATRSPGTYNATLGDDGTLDAFIAQARRQSATFWRAKYLPAKAADYVKAGFSGQRIDTAAPVASLDAPALTAGGAATYTFDVTYTDDNQVNAASIGNGDVLVTGPGGYRQAASPVSVTTGGDGTQVSATYSVPAPNGSAWGAAANGTYAVAVVAGAVTDKGGNAVPAGGIGTFGVSITAGAPLAKLVATDVTSTTAPATLTVTYSTTIGGIDPSSLDSDDLVVTGPDGTEIVAQFVGVDASTPGTPRVATYTIDPPAGGWTSGANGLYGVAVRAGEVTTTGNVPIGAAPLGTFAVNVSTTLVTADAPDVTNPTAPLAIKVTYKDGLGIKSSTVDGDDIRVQGPNGFDAPVTLQSKTGAGTFASPLVATYLLAPPGPVSSWFDSQNGTYSIVVQDGAVTNIAGSAVPATPVGSFDVAIDFNPPIAASATETVYAAGGTVGTIRVVYSDLTGVKTSTLGTGDVTIDIGGLITPTFTGFTGGTNGKSILATYTFTPPGGKWDAADNGAFPIRLQPNEVTDVGGQKNAGGSLGGLFVTIDDNPPTGFLYPTPTVYNPLTNPVLTVLYTDNNPGVDARTIDSADLVITGPNNYRATAQIQVDENLLSGYEVEANYLLLAPAGGWTSRMNGTYTVSLVANQVADLSDNFMVPTEVGTFDVAVQDDLPAVPPHVAIDQPTTGPNYTPVNSANIHFDQAVAGFDLADLTLTRDGGPNLLTAAQTLTTSDNLNFVLSGLSTLTDKTGNYVLTLNVSGSGIVNAVGLPPDAGASVSFAYDVTPPTATVFASGITSATTSPEVITVVYADPSGVNAGTIDSGDLIVTGPNSAYSQPLTLASVEASNGAIVATYFAPAPDGGWSAAWNGAYAVRMRSDQVADNLGNKTFAQFLGSFSVNVPTGNPADTTAPTAFVAQVVPSPRSTPVPSMTITFSEPVKGFGLPDLILTRNGSGNLLTAAQGLTTSDNQTFTLSNLSGLTTATGTYILTLIPAGITDNAGNPLVAGGVSAFNVSTANTAPGVPASPSPANGAKLTAQPALFDWADSAGAVSYDIRVDGLLAATVTASKWTPNKTYSTGVAHTWQVVATSSAGVQTAGPTWSFTVSPAAKPPAIPATPTPGNNALLTAQPTTFDWADSAGATSYEVRVDGKVAATVTASKWVANKTFTTNTKHTWQIVAKNAVGSTAGPTWNFTVYTSPPAAPSGPKPATGVTLTAQPKVLDWTDSAGATSYEVWVDNVLKGTVTTSTYTVPKAFTKGVFHTWRIVAKNPKGSTGGPTWKFKVS